MGTGAKIAIGCVVVVVAIGIVAVVVLGGLAFWAKGKADQFTSEQSRIEDLHRKARRGRPTWALIARPKACSGAPNGAPADPTSLLNASTIA